MANLQKYKAAQVHPLFRHYERAKKEDGSFFKFNNQNIRTDETYLNYNLCAPKDQANFLKKRLKELQANVKKNTNVMCCWVITAPKDLESSRTREFFLNTYNFLNNRYGTGTEKNVISSFVHLDETTPHLHYAFVPVSWDAKKNREKLCAKEVITRKDLQTFHADLNRHIKKTMGKEYAIITNAKGTKKHKEMVQESLKKEIKNLEKQTEELKKMDNQDFKKFLRNFKKTLTGKYQLTESQLEKLWKKNFKDIPQKTLGKLEAENKELKFELSKSHQNSANFKSQVNLIKSSVAKLKENNKKLKTENIKLKSALGKIAKGKIILDKINEQKKDLERTQ